MHQYKVKFWTGERYPGGPAVFYNYIVEAHDEDSAEQVAKDYYIRRTGRDNFQLHKVELYRQPVGRVLEVCDA